MKVKNMRKLIDGFLKATRRIWRRKPKYYPVIFAMPHRTFVIDGEVFHVNPQFLEGLTDEEAQRSVRMLANLTKSRNPF